MSSPLWGGPCRESGAGRGDRCTTEGVPHPPGSVLNVLNARRLRRQMTNVEHVLWRELRWQATGVRFRRQVPLFGYVADFFAPACNLVVEVDGPVHGARIGS